jgi:hypothetical protein
MSIIYAKTRDGLDLPVIDFSNPRFAVPDNPTDYAAQSAAFEAWQRRRQRMPRFLTRFFMRRAARRSSLLRAICQSEQGFLDSITTYILKLGADNLPPGFNGSIDKRVAADSHVVLVRLRMKQVAKLLADALTSALMADPNAPLHLINIAGGPALDSINTLIMLKGAGQHILERSIFIHVLDMQADGPFFGKNALAALKQPGGPLHGIDVEFEHQAYDWNVTDVLAQLAARLTAQGAIVAASSEGGLFEYGTDEAIVANLTALAGAGVRFVAGSVTGASDVRKQMIGLTKFKLYPRGAAGLAPLAMLAGYEVAKSEPNVMSDQVLLRLR